MEMVAMPYPPNTASVSVALIRVLQAYAERTSVDFNAVAAKAGFDIAAL